MAQPLAKPTPIDFPNPPQACEPRFKLEDVSLVRAVARGDQEAFEELYLRHAGRARSTIASILWRAADVEEVLQDTFHYLWRRAHTYSARRGSVLHWLRMIARSRAIDQLRSLAARQKYLDRFSELPPRAPDSSPLTELLTRERSDRLADCLRRIPEPQREILELCYFGDITQQEAANSCELPLGTVKTRCYQGLKKLRRALRSHAPELVEG